MGKTEDDRVVTSLIDQLSKSHDRKDQLETEKEYEMVEENLNQRLQNSADYLTVRIHFRSGNIRTLHPYRDPILTLEFDRGTGTLKNWIIGPDGQREELSYPECLTG